MLQVLSFIKIHQLLIWQNLNDCVFFFFWFFLDIKYANDWKEDINNQPESLTDNYQTTTSFIGDHKHTGLLFYINFK